MVRLFAKCKNSLRGISVTFCSECSFRLECLLFPVLVFSSFYFDFSVIERVVSMSSLFLVLIVELMNTAIEKMCDFMCPDKNNVIRDIKDIYSAAVMISLLIVGFVYLNIILEYKIF